MIESFTYDVFLSYSHRDQQWVREELLRQLHENGLKVCIDFQDFEAGAPIVEEIVRAVEQSRKTLLVLTENYLTSDWTKLESYLLQTGDPANIQRRLIPLRKSACQVPNRIKHLVPVDLCNADNLDTEWKKLLKAIGVPSRQRRRRRAPAPASPETPITDRVDTTTRSARQGLEALLELVRDPAGRDAIVTFRAVFAESSKQIEILGYYKDLHDLLHTLQFKCYNYLTNILRDAQKSPGDAALWDNVVDYELTLQNLIDDLYKLAGQENLSQRTGPWVQRLDRDLKALFTAIKACDAAQLQAALRPLKSLLATEPTRLNTRLTEAARTLPLVQLRDVLAQVYTNLDRANIHEDTVSKFKHGVDALGDLSGTLTSFIEDHDQWQRIDDELRRVEATLTMDPDDLLASWPELKEMTDGQCRDVAAAWAPLLAEDSQKLDEAIRTQDPNKVKQYFRSYRSRVSNRFYQVDMTLKDLCDQLRRVGAPLALLLEVL